MSGEVMSYDISVKNS